MGLTAAEGSQINKSLSALGNVVNALTDPRGKLHVPYRCGPGWRWMPCLDRRKDRRREGKDLPCHLATCIDPPWVG